MENKQKPSKLVLVPAHHVLLAHKEPIPTEGITEFTSGMLDWEITNYQENKPIDLDLAYIYKEALKALLNLEHFNSAISMGINLENKTLSLAYRTWGKIVLNDGTVVAFTHDSREENNAFYSLLDWPELPKSNPNSSFTSLYLWGSNDWLKFFQNKIKESANVLQKKANDKKLDAQMLEDRSLKILSCFS